MNPRLPIKNSSHKGTRVCRKTLAVCQYWCYNKEQAEGDMAKYRTIDVAAGQGLLLTVNLQQQLLPGIYEYMLHFAREGESKQPMAFALHGT